MISNQLPLLQSISELNRSLDASASLILHRLRLSTHKFLSKPSKNLRVSSVSSRCLIFKVRSLSRRASCILPHSRPFVNTFFRAAFSLIGCARPRALDYSIKSSSQRSIILSNPPPFVNSLFPPLSPSLYTPPRVPREENV